MSAMYPQTVVPPVSGVICAGQLGKRYRHVWALRGCDLEIPPARLVALVGPNGAGKSTLLQLMVGLLQPTEGTMAIFGQSPRRDRMQVLPEVGFVAQDHPLFVSFTVGQMVEAGRRLNQRWERSAAEDRLRRLGIPLDRQVRHLSGGQQAQVALTLALAKRPRVLLLDEPVAGLDPLARNQFLHELADAARTGQVTVVLSSHVISELERICDYLVILNRGRVQVAGPVDELLTSHRLARVDGDGLPTRIIGTTPDGRRVAQGASSTGDPAEKVTLEDVVLAYLGDSSSSDTTTVARAGDA